LAAQVCSQLRGAAHDHRCHRAGEVGVVAAMVRDCRWPSRGKAARQASVPAPALCSAVSTTPPSKPTEDHRAIERTRHPCSVLKIKASKASKFTAGATVKAASGKKT